MGLCISTPKTAGSGHSAGDEGEDAKLAASSSSSLPAPRSTSYHLDNLPKRSVGNGHVALNRNSNPGRGISSIGSAQKSVNAAGLAIAQETLEHVRSTYYKSPNFKSSNKIRTRLDRTLEIGRLGRATEILNQLYSKYDLDGLMNAKAHNCGELSILAVISLCNKNVRAVKISIGGAAGTHAFAAIVPPDHGVGKQMGNDMNEWSENIIICDPWANIACPAPRFNGLFREKMNKWEGDGKFLASSDGGYHEYPANDKKWMDDVIMGNKVVTFAV